MREVRHRLKHVQVVKVVDWLRKQNPENLKRTSGKALCRLVESELGIVALPRTLKRIADEMGIELEGLRTTSQYRPSVITVANALAALYERLGEPLPDELQDLLVRFQSIS